MTIVQPTEVDEYLRTIERLRARVRHLELLRSQWQHREATLNHELEQLRARLSESQRASANAAP